MSPPKKRNESHRSAPPPLCAATSCRRRRKIIAGRGMIFSLRTAFILAHAQGRCASDTRKPLPCAPPLSCAPLFLARFLCAQQRKRAKAACKGGAPRLGANAIVFLVINRISELRRGHPTAAAIASLASENAVSISKIRCICCEFCSTARRVSRIKRTRTSRT